MQWGHWSTSARDVGEGDLGAMMAQGVSLGRRQEQCCVVAVHADVLARDVRVGVEGAAI